MEASIVTFPANRRARVDAVKSELSAEYLRQKLLAGDRPTVREWEKHFLKGLLEMSNSEAERVARLCFKDNDQGEPDEATLTDLENALKRLRSFKTP
jgi:hypothetical protein